MATSKNPTIQELMNEVEKLDVSDQALEAKLQKIAEAIAAEQRNMHPAAAGANDAPIDPADEFACEGCQ